MKGRTYCAYKNILMPNMLATRAAGYMAETISFRVNLLQEVKEHKSAEIVRTIEGGPIYPGWTELYEIHTLILLGRVHTNLRADLTWILPVNSTIMQRWLSALQNLRIGGSPRIAA